MSSHMGRRLSHLDASGRVRMVDVSGKRVTLREAVARGKVFMHRDTLDLLRSGQAPKGDVIATAHLAGVMAAKRTSELIPLAHPLALDAVEIAFRFDVESPAVEIESRVRTRGRTGVEMEALTAVTVAGLALYDMLKKRGGRSGAYRRR